MGYAMAPGSVVADIAAERGGNCELTKAGETVDVNGVQIIGPLNLPSTVPFHASQMYARNLATFVKSIVKDKQWNIDMTDEVVRETTVARGGKIVNPKVQSLLGTVVTA